jgi:hypothetical protein
MNALAVILSEAKDRGSSFGEPSSLRGFFAQNVDSE